MVREILLSLAAILLMCTAAQAGRRTKHHPTIIACLAALYLCGLLYLTTVQGNRTGVSGFSFRFPLPFWRALCAWHFGLTAARSLLNLLLFVPFGYLLPQLFPLRFGKLCLMAFLCSLLIESAQVLFHFGVFELDDLVKNTLGAGAGYLLYRGLDRLWERRLR